jgi:hypothetical protein
MARPPIFEWHGKEYHTGDKSADWYWAVGIVVLAIVIVSVLFGNFILALLAIAAGVTLMLQAAKNPRIHRFSITETGITIDLHTYPFENMLHFSVLEYADESLPPSLSVKTKSFLFPHIVIPIIGYDPVDVYDYIAAHVPEGNHHESAVDRLIELMHL